MSTVKVFLCSILVFAGCSGSVWAAKVQPTDCLCYNAMVELTAAASCKDSSEYTRTGRGKQGLTKNLQWVEDGQCTRINVSAGSARVDVFQGEPSGPNCDWDGGQRCRMDLTQEQVKACDFTLRPIKREIRRLPDCQ